MDFQTLAFFVLWLHVLSGILWFGSMWFFDFILSPKLKTLPDAMQPKITDHLMPNAFKWFKGVAISTIVFGLFYAYLAGFLSDALELGWGEHNPSITLLGIGMWLGIIMGATGALVIEPNLKKALGLIEVPAEARIKAAKIGAKALNLSVLLSIPLLFAMVGAQNYPF